MQLQILRYSKWLNIFIIRFLRKNNTFDQAAFFWYHVYSVGEAWETTVLR